MEHAHCFCFVRFIDMQLAKKMVKRTHFVLILILSAFLLSKQAVFAKFQSCELDVSPNTVQQGSTTDFTFSASAFSYSGDGENWVKITRPSGNFTINSGSPASGWSVSSTNSNDITFTHPSVDGSGSLTFIVNTLAGNSDASSADWTMQISDSGGGQPAMCTVHSTSMGTAISGSSGTTPSPTPTPTPIPDTSAPVISNVVVSGVSESAVTISWDTNESSNSVLNYGTSTSYSATKSDGSMVTSHALTISSLSSATTYHGQIQSSDSTGNAGTSSDFTFATAQHATSVTVTTTTTVSTTTLITPTPTPTPLPDLIPPKVSLSTDVTKIFLQAPKIEGKSSDNEGVGSVEYSVDDGGHWALVDQLDKIGEKKVTFSFTPLGLGDGNYQLKVRSTDIHANKAETKTQTFIIDRLPPAIGGALFSIGPQILQPTQNGSVYTLAGLMPKLTFAAVGGPREITLKMNNQSIAMQQNAQTRLWTGSMNGVESGRYLLEADSIDDAQNRTQKSLNALVVLPNGVVSNSLGPVFGARLSVYYFDSQSQSFRLWAAEQYGQQNPQQTDEFGRYKLLLPAGTYYMEIVSAFNRPLRSKIFSLKQTTPISQNFTLTSKLNIHLGLVNIPFPDFGQNDVIIEIPKFEMDASSDGPLIGKAFPDFNLDGVRGDSFTGKPTLVTVLATWLPQSSSQMNILEELSHQNDVHTVVIMSQESKASVDVFAKRGVYSMKILADPDGLLVSPLGVTTLPTHYFLDRKGIVTKVVSGVISSKQIEEALMQ